ncbi:MAG: hypothetical protein ACOC6P_00015 [Candidatus Aminicenantaceae bacterium]
MSTWLEERIQLGRTDLYTGRLGLGSSYTMSSKAIETAFEAGCNFFYWGAIRTPFMARFFEGNQGKMSSLLCSLTSGLQG